MRPLMLTPLLFAADDSTLIDSFEEIVLPDLDLDFNVMVQTEPVTHD